jgi:hypothetical protein
MGIEKSNRAGRSEACGDWSCSPVLAKQEAQIGTRLVVLNLSNRFSACFSPQTSVKLFRLDERKENQIQMLCTNDDQSSFTNDIWSNNPFSPVLVVPSERKENESLRVVQGNINHFDPSFRFIWPSSQSSQSS